MEVRPHSFTCYSPSLSVRGRADPSKRDGPAYPHDPRILSEEPDLNRRDRINGCSTPLNESFKPQSKGGASHALPTTSPGKFKCPLCPKRYVQQQGLNRHLQDKHEDGLKCHEEGCPHKWIRSREADYRKLHLGRKHGWGDEKISEKLGRSARRHRRKSDSESPPHFSPPPIKRRQSLAEPQQCPPMLALLSGEDANHAFTPLFPPVAHNPQFGHENSSELKHLAHTLAPSRLLSEEESALVYAHWKIRGNYFRFL